MDLIECPNCLQRIPGHFAVCQFCNQPIPANLRKAVPKASMFQDDVDHQAGSGFSDEVVWRVYNGMAIFWMVTALWGILDVLVIRPGMAGRGIPIDVFSVLGAMIFLFRIVVAVGLLQRWEWARKVGTWISLIGIIVGLRNTLLSTVTILAFGPLGILIVLIALVDLALSAAIFWAIGETDRIMARDRMNYRR